MNFDIKVLKKVRSRIISVLSGLGYSIPSHYNLSPATENIVMFTLQLMQRQNAKLSGQMKAGLEKSFGDQLEVSQKPESLRINTTNLYKKISEEKDEAVIHATNALQSNPVSQDMYEKLCNSVITHLEQAFYKNKKLSEVGITIAERKKADDSIKIIFAEDHTDDMYPILRDLEKHPEFKFRLAVMRNIIFIMQEETSYEDMKDTRGLINNFLAALAEKVKDHNVTFGLITPMTVAVTTDPVKLQIEANTPNGAILLHNKTSTDWNPSIEKKTILSIQLYMSEMKDYIEGKGNIKYPQKLVEVERPKEDLTRIIPFGKSWETTLTEPVDSKKKGLQPRKIDINMTGAPVYGYVQQSTDYNDFHFLPFNRKVNRKHVRKIMSSVEKNGVMGFVTVAITNVIDGVMRKYIVDGQHRYWAFKNLGLPILFTYTYAESKRQLVTLIATLNNTSKSWALRDYLHAWNSVDSDNYGTIKEYMTSSKLQITVLLEAFSGLSRKTATDQFQNGLFVIPDKETGKQHVEWLLALRKHIAKSRSLYSALLTVFRQIKDYNSETMMERLVKKGEVLSVLVNESQEDLVTRISNIYHDRLVA
jgi:hypothetical protein